MGGLSEKFELLFNGEYERLARQRMVLNRAETDETAPAAWDMRTAGRVRRVNPGMGGGRVMEGEEEKRRLIEDRERR